MNLLLRPNPSSGVPLYLQLVDQVKRALSSGALRAGDELPEARPLAQALVISPGIVARAYRALEGEGVITATGRPQVSDTWSCPVPRGETPGSAAEAATLRDTVARLTATVETEVANRVKRHHELESAREVQERLLPQECPAVAGLDYAGACHPALTIGGDYYDFIPTAGGGLGIAIGDVCGKGIPAALLMATLRALLRGQTLHAASSLPETMAALNQLIFESSSANRYASLFYAHYDAETRTLEYVNAGHPPPLVFRTTGNRVDVIRLDANGPVIGWMPGLSWTEGRLELQPGDLLVAVTDGITEAMDPAFQEWGEDRLCATVMRAHAHSAQETVDLVMRSADAFAGAAEQHDDMTLVAVRVL